MASGHGGGFGSPRRASLSPGTVVARSPPSPDHSRPLHAHEDGAPPPLQNVFLGTLPQGRRCPATELAGRPRAPEGTRPGGCLLSTEDPAARALSLGRVGSGDSVVSLPVSPGLPAAWPVPPCPAFPPVPKEPGATPCGPRKQPSSGRKTEGKLLAPPTISATATGPARPGASTRDSPLAPLWPGRHRSPNTKRVHKLRDTPWHRVLGVHGTAGSHPAEPPHPPRDSSRPRTPRALGIFGASAGSLPRDRCRSSRPCPLAGTRRPALAAGVRPSSRVSAPRAGKRTAISLSGRWKLASPSPCQPPGPTHQARALPGLKCYLSLRAFAISLFSNYYFETADLFLLLSLLLFAS